MKLINDAHRNLMVRRTAQHAPDALTLANQINKAIPTETPPFVAQLALAILLANLIADQSEDKDAMEVATGCWGFMLALQAISIFGRKDQAQPIETPPANAVRTAASVH